MRAKRPQPLKLPAQVGEYIVDVKLGAGAYGYVYRGYRPDGDRTVFYALKINKKEYIMEKKIRRERFKHELEVMTKVNHPNVMHKLGFFESSSDYITVMKYCETDLQHLIENNDYFPESKCIMMFKQLMSGVQELYKHNVCHRDIKPENIFVQKGNFLVIGDFGFSKIMNDNQDILRSNLGTPLTMAPEMWEKSLQYTSKVDIWALGCVFYFILFKKFPFYGQDKLELRNNIMANADHSLRFSKKRTQKISPEAEDLLRKMLENDEKKRIGWTDFFIHPLFLKDEYSPWAMSMEPSSLKRAFSTNDFASMMLYPDPKGLIKKSISSKNLRMMVHDQINENFEESRLYVIKALAGGPLTLEESISNPNKIEYKIEKGEEESNFRLQSSSLTLRKDTGSSKSSMMDAKFVQIRVLNEKEAQVEEWCRYCEHCSGIFAYLKSAIAKLYALSNYKDDFNPKCRGYFRTIGAMLNHRLCLIQHSIVGILRNERLGDPPRVGNYLPLSALHLFTQTRFCFQFCSETKEELEGELKNLKMFIKANLKSIKEGRTMVPSNALKYLQETEAALDKKNLLGAPDAKALLLEMTKQLVSAISKKGIQDPNLNTEWINVTYRISYFLASAAEEGISFKEVHNYSGKMDFFNWFGFYQEVALTPPSELIEKRNKYLGIKK